MSSGTGNASGSPPPLPKRVDAAATVATQISDPVLSAAQILISSGYRTVFVGGGVRDALLGREVKGLWDLATQATPDQVTTCFPQAIPTGLSFGTVTVPIEAEAIEITTFRTEGRYSDSRRPDEVFFVKELEPDLMRRDFTINAIAYDPASKELIDISDGWADLEKGLIRAVGDAEVRFQEDALRALRAARFVSTLGFALEAGTRDALPAMRDLLPRVSAERIRDELDRLLVGDFPDRGLLTLDDAGLLEVILPELTACKGVSQNRFHRFDVFRHTLETIRAARPSRRVRWASLAHDLGKPGTHALKEDGEASFYGHPQLGAKIARKMLTRLRFARADLEKISLLVNEHLFDYQPEWTDAAVRRFLRRVGVENLDELFALRYADILGTGFPGDTSSLDALQVRIDREIEARRPFRIGDLAINGEVVMKECDLESGPIIGTILEGLLEEVLENPELNTRERLLERLRERLAGERGPDPSA